MFGGRRSPWSLSMVAMLAIFMVACLGQWAFAGALEDAVGYLRSQQRDDGGFAEPGSSTVGGDGTTAWAILGLSAAGVNPNEVIKNGLSPLDFLATKSDNWESSTDIERTMLAVAAAGRDPTNFGGMNLVSELQSHQRSDGSIGGAINSNAFGILAFVAAGPGAPGGAVSWHRSVQNPDGGWGNAPGQASNPDMTAASVMAFAAAGITASDATVAGGLNYFHSTQNEDGGFSFQPGSSDTGSTSWAVQALVAVGEDPAGATWSKNGSTPYSFVAGRQASDGHFEWYAGRTQNPVWMTSYSICALARKPYPIRTSFGSPGTPGEQVGSPPAGQETTVGQEPAPETVPDPTETAAGVPGVEGVGIQGGNEGEQATAGESSDGSPEGAEALNDGDNKVASGGNAVETEDNAKGLGWVFYLTVGIGGIALLILLGALFFYRKILAGKDRI